MLLVVSDSSPLIYLARLGRVDEPWKFREAVVVPPAAWEKVAIRGQDLPESQALRQAIEEGRIQVRRPETDSSGLGPTAMALGPGEMEAILPARERPALLATDDDAGRECAEHLGLRVTATIGLPVRAEATGYSPVLKPVLDQLRQTTNFRMSDDLYHRAIQTAGEEWEPGFAD